MTVTTLQPIQTGFRPAAGSTWTEDPLPTRNSSSVVVINSGFRFNLGATEKPIPRSLQFTFTLDATGSTVQDSGGFPAAVVLVRKVSPVTPFANGGPLPPDRTGVPASLVVVGDDAPLGTSNWMFAATLSSPNLPTGVPQTVTIHPVNDVNFGRLSALQERGYTFPWGQADWTGHLHVALWLTVSAGPFTEVSAVSLTLDHEPFFSGLAGGPTGPRQRFVRDHRYGMPALNQELVRDGDQPGLWVRPWDRDSEDEPARYKPRPGEGTVDDDING